MKALTLAGAIVVLLACATSASSQGDAVTMVVTEYRDVSSGLLVHRFSGVAGGGAAGEVVDIVGRDCGSKPGDIRLIAQTLTRAGGGYQVENPEQVYPYRAVRVDSGIEFRARWKGQLSDPYVWRKQAFLAVTKVPKRRAWKVHALPPNAFVSMQGKVVELQRNIAGRWVRYRRAKLVRKPNGFGALNHEARFNVPKRGLRLRAVLPTPSALPCFLKTVTPPWRS